MTIRPANTTDIETILTLIDEGRRRLRRGGVDQWQDGYPSRETVGRDIRLGYGRILCEGHVAAAYAAFVFDGEPAYERIEEGGWLSDTPYVAVHRLAVGDAFVRCGMATKLLRAAAAEARTRNLGAFRIDTHPDNRAMQALLEKEGFGYRGKVYYEALRYAYEKQLVP